MNQKIYYNSLQDMKQLKSFSLICEQNRFFVYLLATLLTTGAAPFFLFEKVTFFRLITQWHHPITDHMALYLTWLGDGFVYLSLVLVLALLSVSCRKLMVMLGSFVAMSIVVQLLKRIFFSHMLRPIALLPLDESLHLVDGVSLLSHLSFPSGHAATIFLLVSLIQLFSKIKKKIYSLILLSIALLVAYSRIYLCQHFYTDVYVGACIGTLVAFVVYTSIFGLNGPKWLNRSIYFLLHTNGKGLSIRK